MSGACLAAQGFLFLVVRGLSDCRLPLLFFSGCCPVLLCVFPFPWSCLFLWWPALPHPYVSPLGGPFFLSPAVAYSFFCCRWLRYVVFSTLLPFLCYDGSALRLFRVSSFHLFCSASAFLPCSFPCLSFRLGAFFFSPVGLLFLGFSFPPLLVTCSKVSWPLVDILFGY